MLHAAGATVRYGFFSGGHDWALWRAQTPRMLIAAGQWFEQRPGGGTQFASVGKPLSPAQFLRARNRRHRQCLALKPGPGVHIKRTCLNYRRQVLGRVRN
jgi:hypothetical protein